MSDLTYKVVNLKDLKVTRAWTNRSTVPVALFRFLRNTEVNLKGWWQMLVLTSRNIAVEVENRAWLVF